MKSKIVIYNSTTFDIVGFVDYIEYTEDGTIVGISNDGDYMEYNDRLYSIYQSEVNFDIDDNSHYRFSNNFEIMRCE